MQVEAVKLLDNVGATGTYKAFRGGRTVFAVEGTFGGATVTLVTKGVGSGDLLVAGSALTANGAVALDLAQGEYKAVVTGGAPANLYSTLAGVPGR